MAVVVWPKPRDGNSDGRRAGGRTGGVAVVEDGRVAQRLMLDVVRRRVREQREKLLGLVERCVEVAADLVALRLRVLRTARAGAALRPSRDISRWMARECGQVCARGAGAWRRRAGGESPYASSGVLPVDIVLSVCGAAFQSISSSSSISALENRAEEELSIAAVVAAGADVFCSPRAGTAPRIAGAAGLAPKPRGAVEKSFVLSFMVTKRRGATESGIISAISPM